MWPQLSEPEPYNASKDLISDGIPFLVFLCILGALLWLVHVLLENRRWNRIFKLQTDVHGKLIERFGTSQEVLTYMSTEAGKRFLEATPIAVGFEPSQPMPSPVARVLTPLQIGIVMSLLGARPDLPAAQHSGRRGSPSGDWHGDPDARTGVYHFRGCDMGAGPASRTDAGQPRTRLNQRAA